MRLPVKRHVTRVHFIICAKRSLSCRLFLLDENWAKAEQLLVQILQDKRPDGSSAQRSTAGQIALRLPEIYQSVLLKSSVSSSAQVQRLLTMHHACVADISFRCLVDVSELIIALAACHSYIVTLRLKPLRLILEYWTGIVDFRGPHSWLPSSSARRSSRCSGSSRLFCNSVWCHTCYGHAFNLAKAGYKREKLLTKRKVTDSL